MGRASTYLGCAGVVLEYLLQQQHVLLENRLDLGCLRRSVLAAPRVGRGWHRSCCEATGSPSCWRTEGRVHMALRVLSVL